MEDQTPTDSDILFKFSLSVSAAIEPLQRIASDTGERVSLRLAVGAAAKSLEKIMREMVHEADRMGMIEDAKEIAEMHAQEEKEDADANAG